MEEKPKEINEEKRSIWISHSKCCISFGKKADYERVLFLDDGDMWRYIYRFVERGYRIQ